MGKTVVSSMIARQYSNIIILSPLRYLTQQLLSTMTKLLQHTYEPILISCDGKRYMKCIKKHIGKKNIFASTYDSCDVVLKILSSLTDVFIIIDEFHNLSDANITKPSNDMYNILNTNHQKMYMSATPIMNVRHVDIYTYSWLEAIKNGYICDFSIIIPEDNEEIMLFEALLNKLSDTKKNRKSILKIYFMLKGMFFNGNRKCICYATSIAQAELYETILLWMTCFMDIEIYYNTITCMTSKSDREIYINKFRTSRTMSVLVNVHVLDEGVDIPECDTVFITKPSDDIN